MTLENHGGVGEQEQEQETSSENHGEEANTCKIN